MPSATEALRAKWGGGADHDSRIEKAAHYLTQRGYLLMEDYHWELPSRGHVPTEEECSAVLYMMQEWDYGSLNWVSVCPGKQRSDPVHMHDDGTWWFFDEVWVDEYGPYDNEANARVGVNLYAENL